MREFLEEGLQVLNIQLEDQQIEKLLYYVSFLLEYNQHTNLTAIREEKAVLEKHILDSLLLQEFLEEDKKGKKAIDIGTGAGFPGMVLAICNPEIHFTLMDSVGKKTRFLEELRERLALDNVEVINARAEDYIQGKRESYDLGFCRGVSKLSIILEYMIPFLKEGAYFFPQKMVGTQEEKEAENALKVLHAKIEEEYLRHLPHSREERLILQIQKKGKSPLQYPRKAGIATKKPL